MKAMYFFLNRIRQAALTLVLVVTLLASTTVSAADGALDPTFGTDGIVVTDLGGSDSAVNIVLQPDGKIVMAARTDFPTWGTTVLARYNADGTLDTTFGTGGKVTAALSGPVALQADGKLIVGGPRSGGFGLARYTSNGALDTTFGVNGIAVGGQDDNFHLLLGDLAIQPDGKIVMVGTQETGGHNFPAVVARFNADGTVDDGFRFLFFDEGNFPDAIQNYPMGVAFQADGKIIMTGYMLPYNGDDAISLGRVTTGPDAWLDPTFGTDGRGTVVTRLPHFRQGRGALAVQADNKIVLAGTMTDSYSPLNENLVLARYTANGTLDTTLDGSGIVLTDLGQNEVGNDLAIQRDGKIVVAGKIYTEENFPSLLLVRYNTNGSLDTTFGDAGKVISNFGGSSASAAGTALQPDGKILAAGAKDGDAVLARYAGTLPPTTTATFLSKATADGWILESTEFSNVGGTLSRTATTFNVGDDLKDKQYRSIISFNTGTLPDNAVITSAQVRIRRQGVVGTNPFSTHGALLLDIRNGLFSNDLDLRVGDFAAPASSSTPDTFTPLTNGWYGANLSSSNVAFVNKYGVTQFRLRFDLDDNDDLSADYLKFYTGESTTANQPQLVVTYVLP